MKATSRGAGCVLGVILIFGSSALGAEVGTAFTYQGRLENAGGPVTDTCDFEFSLWDDPATPPGSQIGSTQTLLGVDVNDGLFTVEVNFGAGAFTGEARWLELGVKCPPDVNFTALAPRQALTPTPHALALPGLYTQQNATSPNVIGGYSGNEVTAGAIGATIAGGGYMGYANRVTDDYGTIGGGYHNTAQGGGTVAGGTHGIAGAGGTVGGGSANSASNLFATVGGGLYNTASGLYAAVGGGVNNVASGTNATICAGKDNQVTGHFGTIGGGGPSDLTDPSTRNRVHDNYGTIAGGGNNQAGSDDGNTTTAVYATVSGGDNNTSSGASSTVSGGDRNTATQYASTVCGGSVNTASGMYSTIGGGSVNTANGVHSTVGGGYVNTASGGFSAVGGGGKGNTASGTGSTVPGGTWNQAGGNFSFAAGLRAKVRDATQVGGGDTDGDEGTFVWADSTDADFTSTGPDQFLVRATGGTGIGTNNPSAALDVVGPTELNGALRVDTATLVVDDSANRIGIGTPNPGQTLDVAGNVHASGGFYEGTAVNPGGPTATGLFLHYEASHPSNGPGIRWTNGNFLNTFGLFVNFGLRFQGDSINPDFMVDTPTTDGSIGTTVVKLGGGSTSAPSWFNGGNVGIKNTSPAHPFHVGTNSTNGNGAHVTIGGVWTNGSDRNSKRDFEEVDKQEILRKVAELPVTRWQYKGEPENVRHIGPVAQDFYVAFGTGSDGRFIGTIDADGVALAAIQGLYEIVKEKECEIQDIRAEKDARITDLEARLVAIEALLNVQGGGQ